MESLNALKNRYLSAKNRAESMMLVCNWAAAKTALEEASSLLGQVYERETSTKNKEIYKGILAQLQEKYTQCKAKLGEAPELRVESAPAKQAQKAKPQQQKPATKKGEKGAPEEDGIVYEFNGVNVKDFLITEARKQIFFSDVIGMEEEKEAVRQELFLTDEEKAFKDPILLRHLHPDEKLQSRRDRE